MVVCSGGGSNGGGGGGGGGNCPNYQLIRGRVVEHFCFLSVCMSGLFNGGKISAKLSIEVSKLKFIFEWKWHFRRTLLYLFVHIIRHNLVCLCMNIFVIVGSFQLYMGLCSRKRCVNRESCKKRISSEHSRKLYITDFRVINRTIFAWTSPKIVYNWFSHSK